MLQFQEELCLSKCVRMSPTSSDLLHCSLYKSCFVETVLLFSGLLNIINSFGRIIIKILHSISRTLEKIPFYRVYFLEDTLILISISIYIRIYNIALDITFSDEDSYVWNRIIGYCYNIARGLKK